MNKRIALDVDDVLAAFTPHAHKFHNVPMEKCDYWCVPTMDKRLGVKWFSEHIALDEEFWKTLPILSSPNDIDFNVYCYVSSFPETMYEARINWLKENGFPNAPLIVSNNKLSTCLDMGIDVLVDDKPATIKSLENSGITGLHFIAPYAGFDPEPIAIYNLKEVKNYL